MVQPLLPSPRLVGLDGDHAAIVANVSFHGPGPDQASTLAATPIYSPDVKQEDIDAAKEILGKMPAGEQRVPHEPERGDADMAALARRQVQERLRLHSR